ncbi:MAG: TerB family tellurite resistance protein [Acidobacteriota bacterium]
MLETLTSEDRLSLVRFVCSFAWADLEITDEERELVGSLVEDLGLEGGEKRQALGWLERPPRPDDVDPTLVPMEHRQLFVQAAREIIAGDGRLSDEELDSLRIFELLLRESS